MSTEQHHGQAAGQLTQSGAWLSLDQQQALKTAAARLTDPHHQRTHQPVQQPTEDRESAETRSTR